MTLNLLDAWELIAIGALFIVVIVGLLCLSLWIRHVEKRQLDGPSHADLTSIRDRLAEMSGHMTALTDRQAETTRMVRTIQQHLMDPAS